jgi:hypothetical protein
MHLFRPSLGPVAEFHKMIVKVAQALPCALKARAILALGKAQGHRPQATLRAEGPR